MIISTGTSMDYINSTIHGENNPIIETEDGVHEPLNRRVEIVIK